MKTKMVMLVAVAGLVCGVASARAESPDIVFTNYGGTQQVCPNQEPCPGDYKCCVSPCDMPVWRVFGELLYLNPRDADVAWGVAADGPVVAGAVPIQVGPVAVADPDYEPGYRIGLSRALDNCTALEFRYSWLETDTHDYIETAAPNVIASMVSHPSNMTAASTSLYGNAYSDIDFQTMDIDFRNTFYCTNRSSLTYLVGARYAHLDEDFTAAFGSLGTESVTTEINFDGGGIRFGLEGERYAKDTGVFGYAKGHASFVGGKFQADYLESNMPGTPVVASTQWEADRILSIVDLEAGLGWMSCNGRIRLSGGYLVSFWNGAVATDEFISAVQGNDFVDLGDGIAFDGLVGRVEFRY